MLLEHGVDLEQHICRIEEPPCTLLQLAVRGGETMSGHFLQQGRWNAQLLPGLFSAGISCIP